MERLLDLWDTALGWAMTQPTAVQILLALGVLAVLYFLYVILATTLVAIYATFFK